MTLDEIAELVCTKCHRNDVQSKIEAKAYIRARYKMLWDSRPWRDSLGMFTLPASSNNTITLPGIVDRVQGVRLGDNMNLLPADLGVVLAVDPSVFERSGTPISFSIIAPSAISGSTGGGLISISSSDSNASSRISVHGMKGTNEVSEVIIASGTSVVSSVNQYDEILSLSKDSTSSDLTVKNASNDTILFLSTTETCRSYQRILLHSVPTESKPMLVLFKRRFRPLENDEDATELTGIDNALLAASVADMLEGQRQFGKAQLKMQESGAMASTMADLERHQSAAGATLIPWDSGNLYSEYDQYRDFP